MRTLVVSESKQERELIASSLQPDHTVDVVADKAAALQILEGETPEAVVLSWNASAPDIIRRLRAIEHARHTYVLVVVEKLAPPMIPTLYQAGADDFIRRPLIKEELVARVEAPIRMGKWQGAAKPAALNLTEACDLRNLDLFQNMGHVVARELSDMVGQLEVSEGWLVSGELRGACIPMTIASENAEIRISVVIAAPFARSLTATLLGDEAATPEGMVDMLREIANTAGGAVKRAAAQEKLLVTTGLPLNEARGLTRNEFTKCWTAQIVGTETQLGIIGEILKHTTQRVPVAKLQEGMVISRDLRNDAGALVMPAGTRLTANAVSRMGTLLGSRYVVEVTIAA